MSDTSARWTLRDLPLAARLTLSAFLISVGIGYLSALVNLHFQEATPGEALPTLDDVVHSYSGKQGMSQWERLLVAHPNMPFNGQGSMRSAFTKRRAGGWAKAVKDKAKAMKLDHEDQANWAKLDKEVQKDYDGERLALIAWAREDDEARQAAYDEDSYPRAENLKALPTTKRFLNDQGKAMVKSIIDSRCVRCHDANVGGPGSQYPLDTYEAIKVYLSPAPTTGKSIEKLALSTHVHLLGFSVLYGLTGVLFALTAYPVFLRVPIAPLALVAQVVDIGCWWLARLEGPMGPEFAKLIPITGAIVATALFLQIILTLFHLFGRIGKMVVLTLLIAAGVGAFMAKHHHIDPYLKNERGATVSETE